jgi:hypothetical protein
MRKMHFETPFQCLARDCDRRGAKGYFCSSDLEKHQRKEHPDAAAGLVKENAEWERIAPAYFSHYVPSD